MKKGKEQEALALEDMGDMKETTALAMNRREEEEEEEEAILQMIETEGDSPAIRDEKTAQGP